MFTNIMGLVGPEGSGKSLFMTYFGLLHLARGGIVKCFPGYSICDGKGALLSSEMQTGEWLTLDESVRDILILIDEIPIFFDSAVFGAALSRLFGYGVVAQRRKRNLGIIYTAHDWMWVHSRIRADTHALGVCWDLYWSAWGKEEHLGRGERLRMNLFDVKGFFSGEPWSPGPSFLLDAKPIWDHYDTGQFVDVASGMQRVKVKKQEFTFDAREGAPSRVYQHNPDEDAPRLPVDLVGDPGRDAEMLNDLAQSGGVSATTLSKLSRRLASG